MLKRILKNILNIILFICLLCLSYFTILRSLIFEIVNAETINIDIKEIEHLANYNNKDIHRLLDDLLKERDLPINLIDEILNNPEHKKVIDDYLEKVITSVKKQEEFPPVPKLELNKMILEGINEYNGKYQTAISTTKVASLVDEMSSKIDVLMNLVNQNRNLLSKIRFVLNDTVFYSLIALSILIIFVMLCLYKQEAIFSLGGISICNSIALGITYWILKLESLQNILTFLPVPLSHIKQIVLISGSIFFVIGVFLILLYRHLIKITIKKKKQAETQETA